MLDEAFAEKKETIGAAAPAAEAQSAVLDEAFAEEKETIGAAVPAEAQSAAFARQPFEAQSAVLDDAFTDENQEARVLLTTRCERVFFSVNFHVLLQRITHRVRVSVLGVSVGVKKIRTCQ